MQRQESKLMRLELGSSRVETIAKIGAPDQTRAGVTDGKGVQVDEYRLFKPGTSLFNAVAGPFTLTATWWTPWLGDKFFDTYTLHYLDGKLDHWGRADENQQKTVADITIKQR